MKKFIRLLTKRRNHGFTLVEMIVSIALLAVLLGGMMIFISPILASYNDNQTLYTAENVANCIQEHVTHTLRNAYAVNIFTNAEYSDNGTAAISDKVKIMAAYVNSKNAGVTSNNRAYELKCLSFRYNDGKYYLCNEVVDVSKLSGSFIDGNDDNENLVKSQKVFSDVLYDNLYMEFDFSLPDENPDEAVEELSKDTFTYSINAYSDSAKKSLVFAGAGMSEIYAVRNMLRGGGAASDYYLNITDIASASGKDIYIYYIARSLKAKST